MQSCNDDGVALGLPLNRALRDEDGDIYDVVPGNFAIVGIEGSGFISMSEELVQKYVQMFQTPEEFVLINGQFLAVPACPVNEDQILLTGERRLRTEDISFADDIMQNDNLLEFYMEIVFDADKVFGTHVCTPENDDYLNVYANFDLEKGIVCDTLDVYLVQNHYEQDYKYELSETEKALLLPKMEEYCQENLNCSLDECRRHYQSEQSEVEELAPYIGETVQAIRNSIAPKDSTCFTIPQTNERIWLCHLDELTPVGEQSHSKLLHATAKEIRSSDSCIEIELGGVTAEDFTKFITAYEVHHQADQNMV